MVCFLLFLSPTLSLFLSPEIVNMSTPRSTSEERDEPTEFRDKIKSYFSDDKLMDFFGICMSLGDFVFP